MIRRAIKNNDHQVRLITQHDHALLSAEIAHHVAPVFSPREISMTVYNGIVMHDSGWPLHDDNPTLNKVGQPIDVFEGTPEIAFKVWSASAERAATIDPYGGLLTSLHVLHLSINATSNVPGHETFDISRAQMRFKVNQFQHRQIEVQETLRKQLGLNNNQPLRNGLSEEMVDPREIMLASHFHFLQAMDKFSLAACCAVPPNPSIEIKRENAGRARELHVKRLDEATLSIDPWPFVDRFLEVRVPTRRIAARYVDVESFRLDYARADVEMISQTFQRR